MRTAYGRRHDQRRAEDPARGQATRATDRGDTSGDAQRAPAHCENHEATTEDQQGKSPLQRQWEPADDMRDHLSLRSGRRDGEEDRRCDVPGCEREVVLGDELGVHRVLEAGLDGDRLGQGVLMWMSWLFR